MPFGEHKRQAFHKVLAYAADRDAAALELRFTPAYRKFYRAGLLRKMRAAHRACLMANVEHTRLVALEHHSRTNITIR